MYYLKISGLIPENKQLEFEQTVRMISSKMPKSCVDFHTTRDINHQDFYQFTAYWDKLASLQSFSLTISYSMLLGSFKTLGSLLENKSGSMVEINDFIQHEKHI